MLIAMSLVCAVPRTVPSRFEAIGVCSLADAMPACWDVDGKPAPELFQELKRRIDKYPYGIRFVQGRKNRFVVLRTPDYYSIQFQPEASADTVLTLGGKGSALTLMRLATPFDAKRWKVPVTVSGVVSPSREIEFRSGRSIDVAGDRIEIAAIAVSNDKSIYPFGWREFSSSQVWSIVFGHSLESKLGDGLIFVPLDRRGAPIVYVDPEGMPVTKQDAERTGAEPVDRADFRGASPPQNSLPLVLHIFTNINPKAIAKLRVTRMVTSEEIWGPFELDPAG